MRLKKAAVFGFLCAIIAEAQAKVYFEETFSDDEWQKRWTVSKHRDDLGVFRVYPGIFHADANASRGLQTSQDAKFYAISSQLTETIDNTDKPLVVQFTVKHEQGIDCGGGYVKLLPPEFDSDKFDGDSKYNIMFGPDICGLKRKIHFILHHENQNKELKKEIGCPVDEYTHLYRLVVQPNQTYSISLDDKLVSEGLLVDDFDLLTPKNIKDPTAVKPEDWVDDATIPDPEDKKPEDWVDGPALIPDPEASKPDDWDDEADGSWEPPQIPNPDYNGPWSPKLISNPDYKGPWEAPLIPNPDYRDDPLLHAFNTAYIGFDLWQVKSGTIFDNILITDDVEYAQEFADKIFFAYRDVELQAKKKYDELVQKVKDEEGENTFDDNDTEEQDDKEAEEAAPPVLKEQEEPDELDELFANYEQQLGIKDEL
ncbi:731_t:CDS:2 [Paraglomus occultum]|uniref:Calreticulin n=1 Tax=Paraglomus occultum TaxID=144539 RepID=A0A9N9CKV8_9GLOM|nr:731_t:CDS:2 [Paraglomus occultum]